MNGRENNEGIIHNRVYVITYDKQILDFDKNEIKSDSIVFYFAKNERDKFIAEYLDLKKKVYARNLTAYYANLEEVDMKAIINAI